MNLVSVYLATLLLLSINSVLSIRLSDRVSGNPNEGSDQPLRTAVFALGSFWRSEASFGCLHGVVHTAAGYCGGSKSSPEYRRLGDHAECVQIEYDPRVITFRQLLEVFWTSHDSRQVFGQGPDVGNQYRSIIYINGTEESRFAAFSKEREQTRSKNSVVTTQIQQLGTFYRAEAEHQEILVCFVVKGILYKSEVPTPAISHFLAIFSVIQVVHVCFFPDKQMRSSVNRNWLHIDFLLKSEKFELKQNPFLLQLIGNLPEEELEMSVLATKLNGYAAELCPPRIQKQIYSKINEIVRKGWPILREI